MKHLFIVHREQPELFSTLRQHFAEDGDVAVIWDRRVAERRAGATGHVRPARERRGTDRRTTAPDSWSFPGFVFVAGDQLAPV
jgi:hypothetical protein